MFYLGVKLIPTRVDFSSLRRGTVNSNYVDDLDSAIQYSNFTFYQYPEYDGTILPSTIHNTTFHGSQNFGDNYSLIFNGRCCRCDVPAEVSQPFILHQRPRSLSMGRVTQLAEDISCP